MNDQMIRVISSPSSSTTGFFTLIFAMCGPCGRCVAGADAIAACRRRARRWRGSRGAPSVLEPPPRSARRALSRSSWPASRARRAPGRARRRTGRVATAPLRGRLLEGVFVDQQRCCRRGRCRRPAPSGRARSAARAPGGNAHGPRFARVLALELRQQPACRLAENASGTSPGRASRRGPEVVSLRALAAAGRLQPDLIYGRDIVPRKRSRS